MAKYNFDSLHLTLLRSCRTFAERMFVNMICITLKYDDRSREAKRAKARWRLALAMATEEELRQMANFEHELFKEDGITRETRLNKFRSLRDKIIREGINKKDLEL